MLGGVPSCWWWCGRCVLSLLRCAPRLPFVVWQRGASCNILVSAAGMFTWVAPTPCCLVVLFYLLVLGCAQVPYSYCMHFAKCFGARYVQLSRLGGSCVLCFSVSVLPFWTTPNSGVKICRRFLRFENTILPFIFAGCACFSWFFNSSLLRSRNSSGCIISDCFCYCCLRNTASLLCEVTRRCRSQCP